MAVSDVSQSAKIRLLTVSYISLDCLLACPTPALVCLLIVPLTSLRCVPLRGQERRGRDGAAVPAGGPRGAAVHRVLPQPRRDLECRGRA